MPSFDGALLLVVCVQVVDMGNGQYEVEWEGERGPLDFLGWKLGGWEVGFRIYVEIRTETETEGCRLYGSLEIWLRNLKFRLKF